VVVPVLAALAAVGCGGAHAPRRHPASMTRSLTVAPSPRPSRVRTAVRRPAVSRPTAVALVTAETENRVLAVAVRTGRVLRRIGVPRDPEDLAVCGDAFVVSAQAGAVSLVDPQSLHVVAVLLGFGSPHIAACSPDGEYAYVTDDARGTVSVIEDLGRRVLARVYVGAGAHHMAFSPDQRRLWVALGEAARTIVILDTSDVSHPRVIGRLHLGFPVHDLSFSADGRRVWLSSAGGPDVTVVSARSHRVVFHVRVGPAPQHVNMVGATAYLTSGYGGVIERASVASGRVLGRARTPHGSFELATADGYVATSSLLNGQVTVFDSGLRRLRVLRLAPATREVAIASRR
jgi:YVTN family beta-propeller protein